MKLFKKEQLQTPIAAESNQADKNKKHHWVLISSMGTLALLVVAGGIYLAVEWPRASLDSAPGVLAKLDTSGASSRLVSTSAQYNGHLVKLVDRNGSFIPSSQVPTSTKIELTVKLQRPSWISWLAGKSDTLTKQVTTPSARLLSSVITAKPGQAVYAIFSKPVSTASIATSSLDPLIHLKTPSTRIKIVNQVQNGQAGIAHVAVAPYSWESLSPSWKVTYFGVAGHTPLAIISPPDANTSLPASSPVEITLSQPVTKVFGNRMPTLTPAINGADVPKGTWSQVTPYTLKFRPNGPEFWPGEQINVQLPANVHISTGPGTVSAPTNTTQLTGAQASTLRLQQILSYLGYLPFNWTPKYPAPPGSSTLAAQVNFMTSPAPGTFTWRWNFPSALTSLWQPGSYGVMTKGAVMSFEQVEGLNTNGRANPLLWPTLIHALLSNSKDPHPYTWIQVSMQLPETLWLYSNGQIVLTNLVNTGIPQTPTATGTYPIYERFKSDYMSGYNPNGTYYHDMVYWINYFNGGDAVHGFVRASYGFPQSLGCVELPVPVAAQVYPQVHIGTLVTVMP
ncbi:MAG: L,D-transpeptidase [Actinobacteria bacterium]|nr:L,D-transpeptidase [Actinomycetota bacterium]